MGKQDPKPQPTQVAKLACAVQAGALLLASWLQTPSPTVPVCGFSVSALPGTESLVWRIDPEPHTSAASPAGLCFPPAAGVPGIG